MLVWERQKGELNLWYSRFTDFRLLGPGRSLLAVYNMWQDTKGHKRTQTPATSWRKACEKWNWRKRAEAWDEHLRQEDEAKWLQRREEIREKEWSTAARLLEKAELMLNFPVSRARIAGEDTIVEPADWKFRDIPGIAETASKLARLAAQMETARENLDVTSKGERIGAGLTDDQRLKLLAQLAEGAGSVAEGPDTGE